MTRHYLFLISSLFLALILNTISVTAQRGNDKIKALKVAHITSELSLTPEEAQQFWPIYNAHSKKMSALRKQEKKTVTSDMQVLGRLTEEEAGTLLETLQDIREKRLDAEQDLILQLRKVLSNKKIILLTRAEDNFKRKLLKQYGEQNRVIDLRRKAMEERRQEKLKEKTSN